MIWGKTDNQKNKAKNKDGDEKIKFAYLPHKLKDGRWIWWEYVRCGFVINRERYWSWLEVVKRPRDTQAGYIT